jgi:predicted TIM-barrel fold metal-dependent hydrolase
MRGLRFLRHDVRQLPYPDAAGLKADRVRFSIDWPFVNVSDAAALVRHVPISEADHLKMRRTNSLRLFRMPDA